MGIAIRTGSPLSLSLAEPMWKLLTGDPLSVLDLNEVDRDYVPGLMYIRDLDREAFSRLENIPFMTHSSAGHQVALSSKFSHVTLENRFEYIQSAIKYRLVDKCVS